MAFAQPNSFSYFTRGEFVPFMSGKKSTTGFDYFVSDELFPAGIATGDTYVIEATGTLTLSGPGTPPSAFTYDPTGQVLVTGLASTKTGALVSPAGTLTLTGVATEQVTVVTAATGTMMLTGVATEKLPW
jgi:hypothetical protein